MANNLKTYEQMSAEITGRITGSFQEWTDFLTTAARLYKYPFPEQLMIYAQRPDATACAEYEVWNRRMRRYVRRGARGIALIDTRGAYPVLRYVFDVSDTGGGRMSRDVNFWKFNEKEHEAIVCAALRERFDVPDRGDIREEIEYIAETLAQNFWNNHQEDLLASIDGSYLEEYDALNAEVAFLNAASVSISYAVMSRCGLEPEEYFQHEDFLSVFDMNTLATVTALGMAVSQSMEQVLRQIEVTIKRYERDKLAERGTEYGNGPDVQAERGLSDSRRDAGGNVEAGPGQIRTDAQEVSGRTSSGVVGDAGGEREAVHAPVGSGGRGEEQTGTADAGTVESGRGDGGVESVGPAALGGPDEHLQGAGGRSDPERTGVRLNPPETAEAATSPETEQKTPESELEEADEGKASEAEGQESQKPEMLEEAALNPHTTLEAQAPSEKAETAEEKEATRPEAAENSRPEQTRPETAARPSVRRPAPPEGQMSLFNLFPPQAGQMEPVRESERVETPSDSLISQEEMDLFLHVGSNTEDGRMKLLTEFAKRNPNITSFVRQTFHHGYGLMTPNGPISSWAMEDGLHFARGNEARYVQDAQILPWKDAMLRISQLLGEGRFATNVEVAENPGYERREIARSMLYLLQDLSDEARTMGCLSRLCEMRSGGFPETLERLAAALEKPESRGPITEEFRQFVIAWRSDPELLRFSFHRPAEILRQLNELDEPRRMFYSNIAELPETHPFITEDEINLVFSGASTKSKLSVRDFWKEHPSVRERTQFLRGQFGISGHSSAISGEVDSWVSYDSRGMELRKAGCPDIQLPWSNVVRRIDALITAGRYLSAEEIEQEQRNHLEAEQDRAALAPDEDEPSEQREAEIPDLQESVQTPQQEAAENATVLSIDVAANVASDSSALETTDTPVTDAPGVPVIDESPADAETPMETEVLPSDESPASMDSPAPVTQGTPFVETDAVQRAGIQSLSPILHSIENVIPWENVAGFFEDCASEEMRTDFLKMRFQMYPLREVLVNVNGREGTRVAVHSLDTHMEIHSDTALITPFRIALTWQEVRRAMEKELGLQPVREELFQAYAALKVEHPNDIVLYQVGSSFEMYGEDAERAAPLLDINLGTRPIFYGESTVSFCGVPANALDSYLPKLRDKYDVTVSAIAKQTGERSVVSFPSFEHELQAEQSASVSETGQNANISGIAPESERGADGDAVNLPESAVNLPETEHGADTATVSNTPEQESPREAEQTAHEEQTPPREVTQDDIDNALRRWNGDMDSKRAVVRYMSEHARERETAAWLSREFGGQESPAFHAEIPEENLVIDVAWPKVQRRIAQLIKQEKFFTEAELDNFEDVDPVVIRETLAQRETEAQQASPAVAQQTNIIAAETVHEQESAPERENTPEQESETEIASSVSTTAEASPASTPENTETPEITPPIPEAQTDTPVTQAPQRDAGAVTNDFLPYKVGDTVYLDNTAFQITEITLSGVQLRDPTLGYPIFRAESKENFERLLRLDMRNGAITEFLAADLSRANLVLIDALTSADGIIDDRNKGYISAWFRAGDGNTRVAQRLSDTYAETVKTVALLDGRAADCFATTLSLELNILDRPGGTLNAKAAFSWNDIAPLLRAMYQQEKNGFFHEAPERPTVHLEGEAVYQVGDNVSVPYPDRDVTGTIAYIGEQEVRIHTGPYAWSNVTVSRDQFEQAIRQDERNADLFVPEEPEPAEENFRIIDEHLGEGGAKTKYRMNVEAIRTLRKIERDGRSASKAEQEILSRYVGWGSLPDVFDASKEAWSAEYLELKNLLTEDEYRSARASTLNAHYTSPTVIKAVYEAIENMGFKKGNILEPSCGIGNFLGLLPESMSGSQLYGVELDSLTGRMARQLYPQARIAVRGYEKTEFPHDFFDLAVGNVPFGNYLVNDPAYNKLGFTIHNYFFAKALDQVRPGGVIAFLTSRYTLDAQSTEVRRYLAKRATLLGAIRLPNNAFKANAGTDVVSDIIFLQKSEEPIVDQPVWVDVSENSDGFLINRYFQQHPDMVLGIPTSESTQYGKQDYTVAPIPGANLAELLHQAIANIHGEIKEAEVSDLEEDEPVTDSIPADPSVRNFSYAVVDGEVYYRENSVMVRPDLSESAKARIRGMVELRDCVHHLIALQMDGSEALSIYVEQQRLNKLYDAYTDKYGLINSRNNASAFSADSSYYLLCSLEVLDNDGRLERKADMFTKRTIKPHTAVTSVDTAAEALAVSIAEKAKVDMAYMSQLSGKSEEELAAELKGVIFLNPMSLFSSKQEKYLTADEYLSGNVRQKLQEAQETAMLKSHIDFTSNIAALREAQPKDLDASEIDVRLGATWVDKRYFQQFMYETFRTPWNLERHIHIEYSEYTSEWNISNKSRISDLDIAAHNTYGTERIDAYHILEDTLNLRDVRIYDTVQDPQTGKDRRVLNQKETTLAQQKQQAIKDAFRDWVWKDPRRRHDLVSTYNRLFNAIRPRQYDGRHITFSGINPEITLREHQLNAIAHVLYGGNTLLAHEVGAGKTFEMVAAAMESKRLGLCQKSLFVVPNHLIEQWASEFLRLYPSANILVASKRDFETRNRKKFCARIATGDYDAIIIGHSQFEKIPVSYQRREHLLQEQIFEIEQGIEELESEGAERFSVKQLERTKRSLEARLEKLQSTDRKDHVVTFEQLGVDRLFVDEAHSYKNLFLYTKMYNVAGLSTTDAQKSSDMLLKCRYMDEITGNKGVIFATGTPVSNSMSELFTMQRYLQHSLLREQGLAHFDNWVSVFGETVCSNELGPEGKYRLRNRLANFYNLPELMAMFREAADIKTADQLHLPAPEVEFHVEKALPTPQQKALVEELSDRATAVHTGRIDPKVDNMLKITSDGRKLGLDQRLINPNFPDNPESKVNMCVNNIVRIWQNGQADRLTQLVFCDLSTPKGKAAAKRDRTARRAGERTAGGVELHALENLLEDVRPDAPFSVYEDIRDKLIARGIPARQIAFIHDADTDAKKKELFAKVRNGDVRVLMGSTFKMGAGTNVQDRLIAMHDLDCPWRPGDLEQRKGRIVRQGNHNPKVHIYRYVTEGTFDSYLWQAVEKKQRFISQIMTSKSPMRSCKDMDEIALSYAEIKALCAGNPLIKEKMDLDIEVARLLILKKDHESQQYRLEDDVLTRFPEEIKKNEGFIAGFEADMATLEANPHPKDGFAGMTLRGDNLTDKDNAGAALLAACKEVTTLEAVEIGTYRGFTMLLAVQNFGHDYTLTLKGQMTHYVTLGHDARGNLTRMDNALAGMSQRLENVKAALENLHKQMAEAKAEIGKPFPQEALLREKSARLAEVNAQLNIADDTPEQNAAKSEHSAAQKSERPSVLAKLRQPLPLPPSQKQETIRPQPRCPER